MKSTRKLKTLRKKILDFYSYKQYLLIYFKCDGLRAHFFFRNFNSFNSFKILQNYLLARRIDFMAALKILTYILLFIVIFFGLLYFRFGNDTFSVLENLSNGVLPEEGPPKAYEVTGQQQESFTIAGQHALLFPNMRWVKMPITVFVDENSCSSGTIDDLKAAAETWQIDTNGIVSFSFINNSANAQVTVQCSSELSRQKEGRIIIETVGETRPRVINTGLYNLTVDAEVAFLA